MGAIADAVWAYAQPLLDDTDGSVEDVNRALSVSQLCWSIAMLPKEKRDESFRKMRPIVESYGEDFEEFRISVLDPMIQRHEEMFRAAPSGSEHLVTGPRRGRRTRRKIPRNRSVRPVSVSQRPQIQILLPSEDLMGFVVPVLNLPFVPQLRQHLATGLFDRVDATGFQSKT